MRPYIYFLIIVFGNVFLAKSQESTFLSPDQPTKCKNIQEGKFLKVGESSKTWYMTIKNGVLKEYYNNGKDYVKAKLDFTDDCHYKTIITGKTEGINFMRTGDVLINEITETDHNRVRIVTKFYNKTSEVVLEKIE